tara:strand:+ start:15399 stop:15656 length:258 start_codon:yes stop_codon:yes gene_type:complete
MPMVKKSITVTDQQESWIQGQIASGMYGNDSEVIREALREKQMRTAELEVIRTRLIAGEKSGFSDQTAQDIRAQVKAEFQADGKM